MAKVKPQGAEQDSEYMLEAVPQDKRRSTFSQIMVWIGFGYVATGLFVGGTLAGYGGSGGLNPFEALLSVVIGMGSLFLITSLLGIAAQKTGLNLSLISRYSYGKKGMIIPMAVMALLTFGWFSSIVGMVADIWGGLVGNPSGIIVFDPSKLGYSGVNPITLETFLACLVWGLIFTYSAVRGISAIEKIAKVVCPIILVVAIVCGIGMVRDGGGWDVFTEKAGKLSGLGIGTGINAVVGSWIAGAVMGVDMFRFNKNRKAVWWCAASCFIFTNPLLNIVGYIGSVSVGQYNYVSWMMGFSAILAFVGVFAWTTSLWTTDNSELYCNALYTGPVLDALGVKANRKVLVLVCGIVGTLLGAIGFYQVFFASFINYLGAIAPPLCAPILADYYLVGSRKYDHAFLNRQPAWRWAGVISFAVGAVAGFLFSNVIPLPGHLPSGLVAMLISFVVYYVIYRVCGDSKTDGALLASLNGAAEA